MRLFMYRWSSGDVTRRPGDLRGTTRRSRALPHRGPALVATLLLATPLALQGSAQPANAASNLQALIATAERNTNSVRTLIHKDQNTITTSNLSAKISAHGAEDEVHNREQDYESVNVTGRGTNGKVQTLRYTVDIIFMNGLTYYRTTLAQNQWKTHKGMTFPDPFTGGWQRARTTVPRLQLKNQKLTFQSVGTSGNLTRVRATFSRGTIVGSTETVAGTVDLWISGGATPYVVREDDSYHSIAGRSVSARSQVSLGPFNTTVVIQAPTAQGTT